LILLLTKVLKLETETTALMLLEKEKLDSLLLAHLILAILNLQSIWKRMEMEFMMLHLQLKTANKLMKSLSLEEQNLSKLLKN